MNSKRLAFATVLFAPLLTAALAGCQGPVAPTVQPPGEKVSAKNSDCPMFGGSPQRNMVNTIDKDTPVLWSVAEGKKKNIKWMAQLGGNTAYGGPVVAGGKIYIGTNQKGNNTFEKALLLAFNEADGKLLWKIVHDFPPDELFSEGKGSGLCSTPVVEGDRLYYVAPGCEVICADTAGKVRWTYDMMKELKVVPHHLGNCSPLIVGDLVMVVTSNGVDNEGTLTSPKAPSFIAVNKKTGKLVWQSSLPGTKIIEGQWSNPALAIVNGQPQVIFPGGDDVIYALKPETGDLIWKCNCNPFPRKKGMRGIDPYFISTPVIAGDRLYIGLGVYPTNAHTPRFSYFLCLDVTKKGDVSMKSYDPKDVKNKGSALVWAFGGPINPPPEKGRQVYFGSTISTAAVHDGLAYINEEGGYLHCLDAKTGKQYWSHDFKTSVWGSPYWVDGKVYIANDDGDVLIFKHGKERQYYIAGKLAPGNKDNDRRVVPSNNLDDGIQSTPVVANGVLYIVTKTKLYAIR
ncbi:MAG: PQQ-binding-like beta-propeller repeat protein [Planctomycetes bacterium]|nr:PQQ-binding-like beta-propeller repeat protein [Planctomycetota bacterium]